MNLEKLCNTPGSRKAKKRVGCGTGSGHGKTSCRGHKGQKARSGSGRRRGFEGGQMPLYRRIPKRGFNNIFRRDFGLINLDLLNKFEEGSEITPEIIYAAGLVKKTMPIKVLGTGKLDLKLSVSAHKFSESAKSAIEKSGGSWKEVLHCKTVNLGKDNA